MSYQKRLQPGADALNRQLAFTDDAVHFIEWSHVVRICSHIHTQYTWWTCNNYDCSCYYYTLILELCTDPMSNVWPGPLIFSRDSRKSRKHGNHGNRDFHQMPWFCQNSVFAVFWAKMPCFSRSCNKSLFLISVIWSLLCDFNTKIF